MSSPPLHSLPSLLTSRYVVSSLSCFVFRYCCYFHKPPTHLHPTPPFTLPPPHPPFTLLLPYSYVLTLIPDGMRGVKNIVFEKAAAGVLASCVSLRAQSHTQTTSLCQPHTQTTLSERSLCMKHLVYTYTRRTGLVPRPPFPRGVWV